MALIPDLSPPPADECIPLLPPHGHEEGHLVGSAKKTFFNIVISIIGAGVLGLPYTFLRSGWLFGSLAVACSAVLSFHCMMLLVRCRQRLGQLGDHGINTYGDLGRHAYGETGHRIVDILVLVSQGGCCVAYLIFIGENLSSVVSSSTSGKAYFILMAAPFQVLLAWVRSLTGLAPFSIVADVANVLAMAVVIKDDLGSFKGFSEVTPFTGWANVPFALGVACYCYEGFSMTLPLEASMKNRARFPQTLGLAFVSITTLYIGFGLVGYLAYGETTKEIITLNLPDDWSTAAVKLGLCLGLFFTFPVMMQPVHEVFERRLSLCNWFHKHVEPSPRLRNVVFKLIRMAVVVVAAIVAVEVPGFAVFISLVGSTVCALLAFVFPAVLHMHIYAANINRIEFVVDISLIVFGVLFACYGTYDTVHSLIMSAKQMAKLQ
eukprot:jgi/Mesen1/5301/ME000264S04328